VAVGLEVDGRNARQSVVMMVMLLLLQYFGIAMPLPTVPSHSSRAHASRRP
jgi:hypothetical protein